MLHLRRDSVAIGGLALLVMAGGASRASAQELSTAYPHMAPVAQYLMADRNAEIALARSAAPDSIARHADVLVLGRHGYERAVKGTNGFVCIVGRGWAAAADPDYWNPKVRVPMCVNAPAARTYLRRVTKITDMALAGQGLDQVNAAITKLVARRALPPMAPGAMCYMMSKLGDGGDSAPHWPSHLMFFFSDVEPAAWGANVPGSPVVAIGDPVQHLTQFVIAAPTWSDGTESVLPPAKPDSAHVHP